MLSFCKICGELEDRHHLFDPMPLGCECNPETWFSVNSIPEVCSEFTGDPSADCTVCCHDFDCHK